jgi:hypothetical protein
MTTSFPIFPANAGTQMQPELSPFLAPSSLVIWTPALASPHWRVAGEVGILCVGGYPQ